MRRRAATLALCVALVGTGCSGDDAPSTADTGSGAAAAASPTAAPLVTAEPASDGAPLVAGLGDAPIVQTTPTSGGGDRPVLAWEAVDGAADYVVMVHDADDSPYWAWTTEDTSVRVGLTDRPDAAPGPRVTDGMTWVVVARDAGGIPVASSPRRPIAP